MLIHGIHTSGTAWQIEADKSCYDRKTLHDYMQHVEQQSHGRTTHAKTGAIRLTTFKNHASLMRADKTLYDVRTNGRALHCDNFDRIWSHLNSVHVNYSDATTKTDATNASDHATYATGRAKLKYFDRKNPYKTS